jgi:hypothetical protein
VRAPADNQDLRRGGENERGAVNEKTKDAKAPHRLRAVDDRGLQTDGFGGVDEQKGDRGTGGFGSSQAAGAFATDAFQDDNIRTIASMAQQQRREAERRRADFAESTGRNVRNGPTSSAKPDPNPKTAPPPAPAERTREGRTSRFIFWRRKAKKTSTRPHSD